LFGSKYLNLSFSNSSRIIEIVKCYIRRINNLVDIRNYDLVLIEKELFPFLPAWFECYFFLSKVNYILDYDDAIFHRYDKHKNKLIRLLFSKKIPALLRGSANVISGNNYILNYANKYTQRRGVFIPTVVDTESYDTISVKKNKQFTIVWIGTPSTSKYVENISDAIREVCKKTNGKLLMIGARANLPGIPVEFIEWSADNEIKYLKSAHVGIMPLPDRHWERGKCGFKIIQYMASKIPVVASPVGVNSNIVEHGVNGYLATTLDDWSVFLCNIANEDNSMSIEGHKKVSLFYSYKYASPILLEVLKSNGRKSSYKP
jgi:glycosyltransferase involved in cell wall biosynthesis